MPQYVTLVNRTKKATLQGTWDGRRYEIKPGKNAFPEIMARKFKDQLPVMGSEDPKSLERLYLVGIEEDGDDCSPIEQSDAASLMDIKKIDGASTLKTSAGGLYNHEKHSAQPIDSNFVKA